MRVRTNLLLWATAVVFMLGVGTPPEVADAAQDSAGRTQRVPADETFAPIAIEELEPCCQSIRSERSDGQTGRTRRRVEVPRGEPVDPAAYRRLKEEAEFDPRAPRGSEVGLAEEALMLPAAPRMRSKFEGLDMKTAGNAALGYYWFPPDTIVAAGPNEVLEATNSALRLSSRANKDVEIQSLNDHFGVKTKQPFKPSRAEPRGSGSARLAGNMFDPKVYFDRLSNRFFVVALLQNNKPKQSFIYLSVSRSSSVVSLENGWCNYRIRGKRSNTWADYPGLGMNGSWLAISANNFKFGGGFFNVYLFVVDKVSLVDNASSCPKLKLFVFKAPEVPGDFWNYKATTVQPAQHYTESNLPGDPLFFVSTGNSPDYILWSITDSSIAMGANVSSATLPPTGSSSAAVKRPTLSRILLQGDPYSYPPDARQKGGGVLLDTGGTRMTQAAYRDGDLWATHATACNFGSGPNESCISVLQITVPSAISGTVAFQQIYGRKNEFFWWPGIAVNKLGDIVVIFQRSSKRMFLSTAYNGKKARKNKMDAVRVLAKGRCNSQGVDRTGDYVGAQTDPLDDLTFWIAGEFSKRVAGLSGCSWSTQIAQAKY